LRLILLLLGFFRDKLDSFVRGGGVGVVRVRPCVRKRLIILLISAGTTPSEWQSAN